MVIGACEDVQEREIIFKGPFKEWIRVLVFLFAVPSGLYNNRIRMRVRVVALQK
ncbi:hypothetical protein BDV93DRAFT_566777 [Ceratobasidium sp. AG-I]|nr:hypothetical protein BDV93DRAFT_566777 [Ceratobasidium sp. AG-I]